ncbi:helix-turn-helix domain-containing protein [Virgibacillus pantothenticus]|uniref:helix-turn-helix domain-containing protein n=1 Tax=Virgibacillus pantothenticus TaxID=1473 RepID=UPI0028168838|nr:helix-turn-helix transcriptional regulator [Virgibacillus pantothenticus]MEB5454287.1 helix-turn-helix transcriptional regulator [Virgibacillus pantothenticus]MEB5458521.1 helix-turn-helix transcriptional regulator [Virgibacillus pantothenticus]MEB5462692.1 helix-turn-helix transcriptional regulator [Virgibacillus pantothenticus]MEB5466877.1 helix-turn-helix transcriptional regulator [Virgibacillus pantothenticus]MEB5471112.1 helix-turn-helix transcriptional regulator [Virgibacillus pantoth
MDIGLLIKLHRLKCKMTQEELSEGIVFLSYLSKIENQKTNASPEILQLLCNRLGIEISEDTDREVEEECKEWYDMLI